MDIKELTPVQYKKEEGIWLKRDDLFEVCGVKGGKSRAAYQVIKSLLSEGYTTIVTAGSRQSPQCEIVSFICESLGVDCKLFMPFGEDTSVIKHIKDNSHTEIVRIKPGYNNVIIARAREYAQERGFGYVPFGMEMEENVKITSEQVVNLPKDCKRIVIPVGSGMSFSSVVTGMINHGIDKPILGVRVGKDPIKVLDQYAIGLEFLDYTIVQSPLSYHTPVDAYVGDVQLDPIYEGKCREFLQEGDCLWIVGKRLND